MRLLLNTPLRRCEDGVGVGDAKMKMKMNIHPRSTKREGMVGDGIRNQESGIRNQSLEAEAEAGLLI
jgi:hypothetical protein